MSRSLRACGLPRAAGVMEFSVGLKGKEQKFCGVFKVKGDQITSAHFYGDASALSAMGESGA